MARPLPLWSKLGGGNDAGVYVWTIPTEQGHLLAYVGESSALVNRWHEHIRGQLGGYYQVYDPQLLRRGEGLKKLYECKNEQTPLVEFTKEIAQFAWENATAYDWYWALFPSDQNLRRAVESAILDAVIGTPDGRLVTTNRSVLSANASRVRCVSTWPDGVRVLGLREVVEYGEKE